MPRCTTGCFSHGAGEREQCSRVPQPPHAKGEGGYLPAEERTTAEIQQIKPSTLTYLCVVSASSDRLKCGSKVYPKGAAEGLPLPAEPRARPGRKPGPTALLLPLLLISSAQPFFHRPSLRADLFHKPRTEAPRASKQLQLLHPRNVIDTPRAAQGRRGLPSFSRGSIS